MDVGVDATAVRLGRPDVYGTGMIPADGLRPEDYRPIHFDEVAEFMRLNPFGRYTTTVANELLLSPDQLRLIAQHRSGILHTDAFIV